MKFKSTLAKDFTTIAYYTKYATIGFIFRKTYSISPRISISKGYFSIDFLIFGFAILLPGKEV